MDVQDLIELLRRAKEDNPALIRDVVARLGLGGATRPGRSGPKPHPADAPIGRAVEHMNRGDMAGAASAINQISTPGSYAFRPSPVTPACVVTGDVHQLALERLEDWLVLEYGELTAWLAKNNAVIAGGAAVRAIFGDSLEGASPLGDVDVWLQNKDEIELPPSWADKKTTVWNRSTVYLHPDPEEEGAETPPPLQFIHVENMVGEDPWARFDYHYCRVSVTATELRMAPECVIANLHDTRPAFVGKRSLIDPDDIRTALRASKAVRKGFQLGPSERFRLDRVRRDEPRVEVLESAQTAWEATIRADPSDLVAAVLAYEPLSCGGRRLESVAVCEGAKASPLPISLKDYREA